MKLFKKTNLSLALTTALAAVAVVGTQQASANLDVDVGAAGLPYVSNNTLGQAMIYPYYTTRDGKSSIINIFNTSNKTIAAKVRFHESHNSRDVLDFNVILSPFDKWSGVVEAGASGDAVFSTSDNTCTVPQIPAAGVALNASAYNSSAFADADADQTTDRMNEGYVEVIAMGQADSGLEGGFTADSAADEDDGNVAYFSTHVNGVPRDCDEVSSRFVAGTGAYTYSTTAVDLSADADADGNPAAAAEFDAMGTGFNPLRGALSIISEDDGVGFGTSAMALADWAQGTGVHNNHITAQQFPYFLEPTIASGNGLWDMSGLPDVDDALAAGVVVNEWANNPANGAATDWVIQFPTKAFHVDIPYYDNPTAVGCRNNNIQAAYNGYRGGWAADPLNTATVCAPTTAATAVDDIIAPFESRFTSTGSPVTVATTTYDKEEREGTPDGVSFSPAQPGASNALPWESNIVTFGGNSVLSSSSPELTLDPVSTISGADSNGQAFMEFSKAGTVGTDPMTNAGTLPVIGFVAKERNQGDATKAYGQIMDHSYYDAKADYETPDL